MQFVLSLIYIFVFVFVFVFVVALVAISPLLSLESFIYLEKITKWHSKYKHIKSRTFGKKAFPRTYDSRILV